MIRPVQASASPPLQTEPLILSHAVIDAIPRPILVPGKPNGFFAEFPLYLQRVAGQLGPLSEEADIDLLDKSLPPAGHSFIQIRQESALRPTEPPLLYQDVWAWIKRHFGGLEDQRSLLVELKTLKSEHSGRITSAE